jgi:transposase-like protein
MASKKAKARGSSGGTEVKARILAILKERALSTKALALELGLAHASVYSRCRRLEDKGFLKSKLTSGSGALYCIDDDKVVDRAEYERCKEEEHELRAIDTVERVWNLA